MFNEKIKLGKDRESWEIHYPPGSIRFIEAFRRDLWDHEGVCRLLDNFFKKEAPNTKTIAEMGSGSGSNLIHLAQRGYDCTGIERNYESVNLARQRAQEAGNQITFLEHCFTQPLLIQPQDAILSLFVPISIKDMAALAENVIKSIKPGGFFACMLLCVEDEYRNKPKMALNNFERVWVDDEVAIRFNFFEKDHQHIDFEAIYLANTKNGQEMFVDRDIYELIYPEEMLSLPKDHFTHIKREKIVGKPNQAPPMTYEVVDIYQKN